MSLPQNNLSKLHASWLMRNAAYAIAVYAIVTFQTAFAQLNEQAQPETSTGRTEKSLGTARHTMISTANRLASEAGLEMLRAGGSATDAAIAAQLVLGLVEPQSSGLGGGSFIVHWDNRAKALTVLDGRETAPAASTPDHFLRDGKPVPFDEAVHSGLSIGTPGTVRLLEDAHRKHGKLAWAKLFEPAIKLATNGFAVSQRLHFLLRWTGPEKFDATSRGYFFDDRGNAHPTGFLLKNPAYAETLHSLASGGAAAFYNGPIADAVVTAAKAAPRFPGDLALSDLAAYTVKERAPLCATYRTYKVCGLGPPSSGGVAIAQILTMLETFDLGSGPDAALATPAVHLIAEAEKLSYADRDRYIADPDFVPVPAGLTDPAYLAFRRALIDPNHAMARPEPGIPPGLDSRAFGDDATFERAGTSHISVVDADGNTVAMTTTIEGAFGSGVMAAGFMLNNELTDFSFMPVAKDGRPAANRVEGGKRPRSSMTPTIVFDKDGEVFASLGSPGGSRIILYVAKTLIGLIDWKLDAQTASALTNFGSMGGAIELEYDWHTVFQALKLKGYGHAINLDLMNSGINVVIRRNGSLEGGSDPRREGAALGD